MWAAIAVLAMAVFFPPTPGDANVSKFATAVAKILETGMRFVCPPVGLQQEISIGTDARNQMRLLATVEVKRVKTLETPIATVNRQFTAAEVAQSLRSFAVLGEVPDLTLLHAFKQRSLALIEDFSAGDISDSLWAFARLKIEPGSQLVTALKGRARSVVGNYTVKELETTLLSLEELGKACRAPRSESQKYVNPLRAIKRMVLGWKAHGLRIALLDQGENVGQKYTGLQAHELATMLFSSACNAVELGRVSHAPTPGLLHAMRMSFVEVDQHFSANDVASLLWAYAVLSEKLGLELFVVLERRALRTIGHFTAHDVSRTLWSFAALGELPRSDLMTALMWRAVMVIRHFTAQDASDTLLAFEKFGETPTPELLTALQQVKSQPL
jgi:hypothetical protein